jgi:hypothetical protein
VDEPKIHGIHEFAEVWDIDYSKTALSARRRQQRWGWLNEEIFQLEYVSMDDRKSHREEITLPQSSLKQSTGKISA